MITRSLGFFLAVSLAVNVFLVATAEFRFSRDTRIAQSAAPASCPVSEGDHHLYQALGLSSPQLERVEPTARAFHSRLDALGQEMAKQRGVLMQLLGQESIDPARTEEVRKVMASIQDEIQKEVISHILELKEVLSPQQRERFFALVSQNMAANP